MKKIKVTILMGAFLPIPAILGGAVEKLWYKLANELSSESIDVTLISKKHEQLANFECVNGVTYKRVKGYQSVNFMPFRLLLDLVYSLRAIYQSRDADIIITNTFWSPVLAKVFTQAKIWVSVHRYPKHQMFLYNYADVIQPVSTAVKNGIVEQNPKLLSKVHVIPNYVATNKLDICLSDKKKTMLFVGRIHPEKGVDVLIKAYKAANLVGWKLIIVGPHESSAGGGGHGYYNELLTLASGCNVEFTGPIFDEKKLNQYYYDAAVFIYPSLALKGEAFGLAPLEAMAFGCQVIVSELSCFDDFCNDANSIRVNLDSGSENLTSTMINITKQFQSDNHLNMLNNSIKTSYQFNLESIGMQMKKLIEKLNET